MKSIIQKLDSGKNDIYIKRDDLLGFSFGGNKMRKAMNFFQDINRGDFSCIVTYGSSSSNHARIIANMAKARNLPCYIISPDEASEETFNSNMMKNFGAAIVRVPVDEVKENIDNLMKELKVKGQKPYFIQGGGHGNLGTKAYVDAFSEISEYENQNGVKFDYIFHASGTGTTQAGLVVGKIINSKDVNIIGISIARKNPRGRKVVLDSIKDYLNSINYYVPEADIDENTIFCDDYILGGYGKYNSEIELTIDKIMNTYGIPLDPTYTAKAYFGMERYIERNSIENKNILFIHTGGTPLYFDYLSKTQVKSANIRI